MIQSTEGKETVKPLETSSPTHSEEDCLPYQSWSAMALSTSGFGNSKEEFFRASARLLNCRRATLSSHEKGFPNILLHPSKLQFLAVAPRYVI